MTAVRLHPLPYSADSQHWFERVRALGQAVWLDSAFPHTQRGRYDIITAAPLATLPADRADSAVFEQLQHLLDTSLDTKNLAAPELQLPFQGGLIALLGYEIGRQLQGLGGHPDRELTFPAAMAGIYSWAIISDHRLRKTWLLIRPETPPALAAELLRRVDEPITPQKSAFTLTTPWRENFEREAYAQGFGRLQHYIRSGDCYQANLSRRFQAQYQGDPFAAYLALRNTAAAPFSAYLDTTDHRAVLCLSPERLLAANGGELFTQPIKGTMPRSADAAIDKSRAEMLQTSEKNRAENLMIVDLLRNDLGRSCTPGSIRVEQLFELQSFATVHHLVSSIRGRLRADQRPLDALKNCFPGGSVTGAPKHRAMQIIDELEPNARSVFCGSIGYVSVCGKMDSNITIRTLLAENGQLYAWAGGGIVADSTCEEEFEETRSKIEPLLRALEMVRNY